jgi:nucleoside-diphosphate-sugar epimerase
MKVAVIGGTGFISSRLVAMLLERGHEVTVLTRGASEAPPGLEGARFVQGSRHDPAVLRDLARSAEWDLVYDMIAYRPEESRAAGEAFAGYVDRFVHCSTISVYMVSNEVRCPITEDQDKAPLMPHFLRNPFGMDYGILKRECEDVLWAMHAAGSLSVAMVRPTFVCGPRDPMRRDWFWIERILDGGPLLVPGSGDHAFQSVYVDDVASAFVAAGLREEAPGNAFNIAGNEIFSLRDYLAALSTLLGREPEIVTVPQDEFDRWPYSVGRGVDVFPFNTRRTAVFSLDRVRHELGVRLTPFDEWMPGTIEWYLAQAESSAGYEHRQEEIEWARFVHGANNAWTAEE